MNQFPLQNLDERAFTTYEGRREMSKSLLGFCLVYLTHYFSLEPAAFHPELLREIENPLNRFLEVIGFRGSAKSTIGSLALPLWAATEMKDQYPFIIPIADTSIQSGLNIANIKNELDHNELLRQDYGKIEIAGPMDKSPEDPSFETDEDWQAKNILLSTGVRILGRSRGQKVRGIRHLQHRPKLVICDDVEDLKWVRTKENRDTTERWLRGEVLPGMDERTGRAILIGNNLHNDGLMARMRKQPTPFKVLEYPLTTSNGVCAWPAKYPTQKDLDTQRQIAGEIAWQREYLLKVVPEEGQIIKEDDIQYYDEVPQPTYEEDPFTRKQALVSNPILSAAVGVDLAISKKQTADYTSMVAGVIALKDKKPRIFILPDPVNERLDFKETIARAKALYESIKNRYVAPLFLVEDVAYQKVATEMMQAAGISAQPVKVGTDKRARFSVAAPFIKDGTVLFPKRGAEGLILQIIYFGVEEHDDELDACVHLILGVNSQIGMQPLDVISLG